MNTPQQEARERAMKAATELQRIFARQFFDEPQIPAVADVLLTQTGLEELLKERDDYKAMHLEALEAYKIVSVKLAAAMKCVEALQKVACLDDESASMILESTGQYHAFDEPHAVRIAREALAEFDKLKGTK